MPWVMKACLIIMKINAPYYEGFVAYVGRVVFT
jgi:hypothetical protein